MEHVVFDQEARERLKDSIVRFVEDLTAVRAADKSISRAMTAVRMVMVSRRFSGAAKKLGGIDALIRELEVEMRVVVRMEVTGARVIMPPPTMYEVATETLRDWSKKLPACRGEIMRLKGEGKSNEAVFNELMTRVHEGEFGTFVRIGKEEFETLPAQEAPKPITFAEIWEQAQRGSKEPTQAEKEKNQP